MHYINALHQRITARQMTLCSSASLRLDVQGDVKGSDAVGEGAARDELHARLGNHSACTGRL